MRVANQEQCDKGRAVAERRGDGDWSDRFNSSGSFGDVEGDPPQHGASRFSIAAE